MRISIIKSILAMLVISASVTFIYYYFRKYRFLGKLFGGIIIAFLGAIIFNFVLEPIFIFFKDFANINVLSVLLGAIIFTKLLNKATPK